MGKLTIDTAKLNKALEDNLEGVKNLFTQNNTVEDLDNNQYGIAARVNKFLYEMTNSTTGILTGRTSSFQNEIKMLDKQIDSINSRLELREKTLFRKFTAMEAAIANADSQMAWLEMQLSSL